MSQAVTVVSSGPDGKPAGPEDAATPIVVDDIPGVNVMVELAAVPSVTLDCALTLIAPTVPTTISKPNDISCLRIYDPP